MHSFIVSEYPWPAGCYASPMVRRRGGRRPLRVLLVGDPEDVKATIGNLHRRGFAEAGAWSKPIARSRLSHVSEQLLPNPHPDDVITILTKYMN